MRYKEGLWNGFVNTPVMLSHTCCSWQYQPVPLTEVSIGNADWSMLRQTPTVRAKALSCLGQLTSNENQQIALVLQELFVQSPSPAGNKKALMGLKKVEQGYDLKGFLAMVKQRACDEKVGVRKAALRVLENLNQVDKTSLDPESVKVFQERCLDPALSVRKQAMGSLKNLLLKYPTNEAF
ncbi:Condensin-2 complex subunit D3 [Holothuria leucospilota]|uniref:Condensin-2 complex subunit D3 n=1 Tax=Holothuria leucospilota TaxID=206669 RepID=A0A9Q1CSD9_HOLLE|nr:Condensin-2 complex subunit D3 [Holothuria leucospilota]